MAKVVDLELLASLQEQGNNSPRKRSNYNLHDALEAPVQRLCIYLHPDTYIPPHKHVQSNKWELMIILDGEMDLLLFDDEGRITERLSMSSSKVRAVEIPPHTWHSISTGDNGATIMEVKEGPYIPITGEGLAPWAPKDNDQEGVNDFLRWLKIAKLSEHYISSE